MEPIQNLNNILKEFGIKANCVDYKQLENYSYFDLQLAPATKVKHLQKYSNEISLALKAPNDPSIKVLHSEGIVRLEFRTDKKANVKLFELKKTAKSSNGKLVCLLGTTVEDQPMFVDIADCPHMLVAGTTGSGKSTLVHNIIGNLLTQDVIIYLLDPKHIEFVEYDKALINRINVGYTYKDCLFMLDTMLKTMEYRYELIRSKRNVLMPYIVLIIDEFADLMMQDKNRVFYNKLCKLAQKCRAAKISIILATQRPSVDIIDGTIKANFPVRIACKTATQIDSRVVLDDIGAEALMGKGDALIKNNKSNLERFQVAYTTAEEVIKRYKNV